MISGSENAKAEVVSRFAVGGCKSLEFKPQFAVSTSGSTSRTDGASLDAKLSYPAGSLGNEANIASVKVELPRQLPSRLTTLQKACTAAQFEANPAGCPAASIVGDRQGITPLLPVALSGPAYFVSHGGEAFPSLIVVLQGDGVRVDLRKHVHQQKGYYVQHIQDRAGRARKQLRAVPTRGSILGARGARQPLRPHDHQHRQAQDHHQNARQDDTSHREHAHHEAGDADDADRIRRPERRHFETGHRDCCHWMRNRQDKAKNNIEARNCQAEAYSRHGSREDAPMIARPTFRVLPLAALAFAMTFLMVAGVARAAEEPPVKEILESHTGAEVNKTAIEKGASQEQRDICTIESKDECQPAVESEKADGFTLPLRDRGQQRPLQPHPRRHLCR